MRAAAYLKRDWMGDNFAALADCEAAILIDPTLIKAYCRRIVALISLGQLQASFPPLLFRLVQSLARLGFSILALILVQCDPSRTKPLLGYVLGHSNLDWSRSTLFCIKTCLPLT